jgi:hypothetical protein
MTGRRARVEGSAAKRSPSNPDAIDNMATAFEQAIAAFQELHPDEWGNIRTWPTESGLVHIAAKLKG